MKHVLVPAILPLLVLLSAGCEPQAATPAEPVASPPSDNPFLANDSNRRMFGYDLKLLPNAVLAENEEGITSVEEALQRSGETIGYPAWNLLYYAVLTSLDRERVTIVETGTNVGFSSVVLAQALKDSGFEGIVHTVDINPDYLEIARLVVERAGLSEYVRFHEDDSVAFLERLVQETDGLDFVFLDAMHTKDHVLREFAAIHESVKTARGKVYFDNSSAGGVRDALDVIRTRYGGNFVDFQNASWSPAGNVIWQGD